MTRQVKEACDAIAYGVRLREGIILLTGEAGTGKTSIIQRLLAWLRERRMPSAFIFNSHLEPRHLYDFMLSDFEVPPDPRWQDNALAQLHQWLTHCSSQGQIPVLIVDEAQGLPAEVLEEIRLLLNLETPHQKLLQVILVGQPELDARLNEPEMRQLKQRITLRCKTSPLTLKDTQDYIQARLDIAGAAGKPIFSPAAVHAAHSYSHGIPRIMNVLCEHALINAYAANMRVVPERLMDEIAREFHFDRERYVPFSASTPADIFAPQEAPIAPAPIASIPIAPMPVESVPPPLARAAAAAAISSVHKVLPFSESANFDQASVASDFSDPFDEVLATAARMQASLREVLPPSVYARKNNSTSDSPSHPILVRKRSDRLRLAYRRAIKKLRAKTARPILSPQQRFDLARKRRKLQKNIRQTCEDIVNAGLWDQIASTVSRYGSLAAEFVTAGAVKANQTFRRVYQAVNLAEWKKVEAIRSWLVQPLQLISSNPHSGHKDSASATTAQAMNAVHASPSRARQRKARRFYAALLPKGQSNVNVVVLRWLRQPFNPSQFMSSSSRVASPRNR